MDRHWLASAFPDLSNGAATIVECGCGVGNSIFALREANPALKFFAFDLSVSAVEILKANPRFDASFINAFCLDFTVQDFPQNMKDACDYVLMIFVLSAVPRERMVCAIKRAVSCLKPGGVLIFRDYAKYDNAQLRFRPANKIDKKTYVRQDSTLSYFFERAELRRLFEEANLVELETQYIRKTVVNRKEELTMNRLWIQARFKKPFVNSN